ncbi:MAG: hypothetical protein LBD46_04020 [Endomicrobium sp.]|jgi:uncharacterized protein (UPF0333 family)|nr:hypothetical protein [Endomicrobium sp.]
MESKILNSKGQTFVEFLLVFIVLFTASSGVFTMYKKVWKTRYEKTGVYSGTLATSAKISGAGDVDLPLIGKIKTDYVK